MTKGLEIRAQIDTENVKGLLLINGGAAIALLAFFPSVIDKPDYELLGRAILYGLLIFQAGLLFAVIHNHLRRICSLIYEKHQYAPPPCKIFRLSLGAPCVCRASSLFMWLSVVAFVGGGVVVFLAGLNALDNKQASVKRVQALQTQGVEVVPNHAMQETASQQRLAPPLAAPDRGR